MTFGSSNELPSNPNPPSVFDPTRPVVKVWDLTEDQAFRARRAHVGPLLGLALSRDGHRLASAGFDGVIHLWDADTLRDAYTYSNANAQTGTNAEVSSHSGTSPDSLARWHIMTKSGFFLPLFELALVVVRLDDVASFVVNANHGMM